MKSRLVVSFICCLFSAPLFAQEKYGELKVSELEELQEVVRSKDRSVLLIVSEIPELTFESTLNIFETRQRGANEWQLNLEPGRQKLTIRVSGYLPVETGVIVLQPKRAYGLKVSQVKPVPGTLDIKTKPVGAGLRINGAPIDARTPYRLDEAPPGRYYVQVVKEGYRPVEKTLTVESSKVAEWETELTQTAVRVQIDLENKLQEVGILIDGEAKGVAPGAIYLEPGSYKLMLQKEGYLYAEKIIDIALGPEELRLTEKLEAIKKPFYRKWWFLTSSAAAIAGGAVYFLGGKETTKPPEPLAGNPVFP